jgi:hypothetical protein
VALEVEVCSHGSRRENFEEFVSALEASGQVFTPDTLARVPYVKLGLCATGVARSARCASSAVIAELQHRRQRFVAMPPPILATCKRYLHAEGMYADVLHQQQAQSSPLWEKLTVGQRVWFTLTCLYYHLDHPEDRMIQTIALLHECAATGGLAKSLAIEYRNHLQELRRDYTFGLKDTTLRNEIGALADSLLDALPTNQQPVCTNELVSNYQCTSDCFRGLRSSRA